MMCERANEIILVEIIANSVQFGHCSFGGSSAARGTKIAIIIYIPNNNTSVFGEGFRQIYHYYYS